MFFMLGIRNSISPSLIKIFKFFIYSIRTNFETLYYIFKLFDQKLSLIGIDRKTFKNKSNISNFNK